MSKQLLKTVGEFIYGEEWQAPLSRDLGVNERSMRRWVSGTDGIPSGVWYELANKLEIWHRALGNLVRAVKQTSELVEVHAFKVWDGRAGEMVRVPRKSTAERIAMIGGQIIPDTAEWVAPSAVDTEGRMREANEARVRLLPEEYDLLAELNGRDGLARISHGRPRAGADRLVSAGYATSRPLNLSDIEYEITEKGRSALLLRDYGIWNSQFSAIEPHQFDDGLWYIKVSSEGDPAMMLGIGAATKLATHLRIIGAGELADRFEREIERARRYGGYSPQTSQPGVAAPS
jgi:hypothetical protein